MFLGLVAIFFIISGCDFPRISNKNIPKTEPLKVPEFFSAESDEIEKDTKTNDTDLKIVLPQEVPEIEPLPISPPEELPLEGNIPPVENVPKNSKVQESEKDVLLSKLSGRIEVFSDFECPFCKIFETNTLAVIRKKHPLVQIRLRYFPLEIHPHSISAAKYSLCAGEQDKLEEMNSSLFSAQSLSDENLQEIAKSMELNLEDLSLCISSPETESLIKNDVAEGVERGVRVTPVFFVNESMYVGAEPIENVEKYLRDTAQNLSPSLPLKR